ncbi:MAG: exonuclease SbcCD subunit D [Lachnospiraceae bacterium]|nr:exonuclease SbcCD subunit D [Lachnospiraceae bacterium]
MKLLHTSDWHLGMFFRGGISYKEDQEYAIQKICEIAVNEKVDGILLAGDVFDKSIASHDALDTYNDVITYICAELNIPVYMIAGNHDGADRISQCSELLKKSGLFICGALEEKPYIVSLNDTDIFLLPWISTDRVKSVYPDEADSVKSMEDAYRVVLDHYRNEFKLGKKNILVAHAYIINGETSTSDKAAEVGTATMVSASVFDGFDYVALGHLHGPQKINDHIRYSGTPMAYSFGKEEKQEKSVVIIDTDTMEQKTVPIPQFRKRLTLKGKYDEIYDKDYSRDILDAYIKLELTDTFVTLETIASFREKFINLLEVSGKSLEREDSKITMTIEDLERVVTNPAEVFVRYCQDTMSEAPSEHLIKLFNDAVEKCEKEEMTR